MQSNNKSLEEQIADLQEENANLQALVNHQDGEASSESHDEPSPSLAPETSEVESPVASTAPSQTEIEVAAAPAPVNDHASKFASINERFSNLEEAVAQLSTQQAAANVPSEPLDVSSEDSFAGEGIDATAHAFAKELGEQL